MVNSSTHQRGVTLVELLVTLALSLTTLAAIYSIYLVQVSQQLIHEDQVAMQQNVRAALDMMGRELRMAGYDPGGFYRDGTPSYDVSGIPFDSTALHIQADLNGNGRLTDPNEMIEYSFDESSRTLRRKVGNGGRQPVSENIESFNVHYLDTAGRRTTDTASIRAVAIKLTARAAHVDKQYPEHEGFRTFTLKTRMTLRNLRPNHRFVRE